MPAGASQSFLPVSPSTPELQAAAAAAPAAVQLPSVATVASHHPLHTTIPFADHTAWIDRCASALERYRQASFDINVDTMQCCGTGRVKSGRSTFFIDPTSRVTGRRPDPS